MDTSAVGHLPFDMETAAPPPAAVALARRNDQIMMLVLSVITIVLAFMLTIRSDGRVAFGFFPSWPVPELCPAKRLYHVACPGCGMTRSIISLAHGHLKTSLRYHHLGWMMAILIGLQIPYRILCLRLGRSPLTPAEARLIAILAFAALQVNWILGMF